MFCLRLPWRGCLSSTSSSSSSSSLCLTVLFTPVWTEWGWHPLSGPASPSAWSSPSRRYVPPAALSGTDSTRTGGTAPRTSTGRRLVRSYQIYSDMSHLKRLNSFFNIFSEAFASHNKHNSFHGYVMWTIQVILLWKYTPSHHTNKHLGFLLTCLFITHFN